MPPYMQAALARPIPGEIGLTATLYLASLESDGKALATRYEYWRELSALGTYSPDTMPTAFTTLDVEAFLLVRCQGLSAATRKKVLAILSGYFGYLHDRAAIPSNPCRIIRRPNMPEPEPTFWSAEDVQKLLATEMPARDHLLLEMLLRTGQRATVIRTLTWGQCDLDVKDPVIRFAAGKRGKVHEMPIHRELLHDLIVFRRMTNGRKTGFVFQSRNKHTRGASPRGGHGPISTQQVNRILEAACRKAGVRVASSKEARRSVISLMLMAGVPLDVVSRDVANHSSPVTTIRHYRGAQPQRVREALRGLPY